MKTEAILFKNNKEISWLIDNVKDRKEFLNNLLTAVNKSFQTDNIDYITECILNWKAVTEIDHIPGMREKIWNGYNRIKNGKVRGPSWKQFCKEIGIKK